MTYPHHSQGAAQRVGDWTVLPPDGNEIAAGLAASPLAAPGFFLGWIGLGVIIGLRLTRRGHDRRTMVALGAGLGPLMFLVAADALRRREPEAVPRVLRSGAEHGGQLDVFVLVQQEAVHVGEVAPTLVAVEADVRTVTLVRVVEYEWLEDRSEVPAGNEVLAAAASALREAADLLPISGAALAVWPGTVSTVVRQIAERPGPTLVLTALDLSATPERW